MTVFVDRLDCQQIVFSLIHSFGGRGSSAVLATHTFIEPLFRGACGADFQRTHVNGQSK
jgi:hypothetical protein